MLRPSRSGSIHPATFLLIICGVIAVLVTYTLPLGKAPTRAVETPPFGTAAPTASSPTELYRHVTPSVVTVIVKDENGQTIGTGSGFFIDQALLADRYAHMDSDKRVAELRSKDRKPRQHGYVLTNYHVIRPAIEAGVRLFDGHDGSVDWVIAEDERLDLALLAVCVPSKQPLQAIPLAPADADVLSTVYAIGSREGFAGSASQGIVSAYREIGGNPWLQMTAPISHGSSGGPLLSPDAQLVGVTTLVHREGQNINFAIPASTVRNFLDTAKFRRRDPAEGASIRWHIEKAVSGIGAAYASPRFDDGQKKGIVIFVRARNEFGKSFRTNDSQEKIAHLRQAIALANEANDSLPDEFKYVSHYVIGLASHGAALEILGKSPSQEEQERRFRASEDAITARHHLAEAIRLKPDFSPAYETLADQDFLIGNWADGLFLTDSLVSLLPRSAKALSYRARYYSLLNQHEEAVRDMRAAIELSPSDGQLHIDLANMLSKSGDYVDAIVHYEMALELLPKLESTSYERSYVSYKMGLTHGLSGNFEKAISELNKAKAMGYPAAECDQMIADFRMRQR